VLSLGHTVVIMAMTAHN